MSSKDSINAIPSTAYQPAYRFRELLRNFQEATMRQALKEILSSVPVDQWLTCNTIIVDWYDGPLEGVCVLAHPACAFYFRMVGEWYNSEGVDDRLFEVGDFPDLTPTQFADLTACGSQVLGQLSENYNADMNQKIQAIIDRRGESSLIIRTETMQRFEAVWKLTSTRMQKDTTVVRG